MKQKKWWITLVLTIASGFLPAEEKSVLLKETFSDPASALAKRLLSHQEVELAKGKGPDGSDAIRVSYVGYERGSKRVVTRQGLKKGVRSATLSFDVMFDEDFQWVRGGKLHGLGPTKPVTGGKTRRPDGWSARIMFRDKGRCSPYLYDQDLSKKWGVGKTTKGPVLKAGKWQSITYELTLNDVGKSNGRVKITIDGKLISLEEDIEFRGSNGAQTLINHFLFSTFHGGQSPSFAPKDKAGEFVTVHAYFDNFLVTEGVRP